MAGTHTALKHEDTYAQNTHARTHWHPGQFFTRNPGTKLLERRAGMTMHGDRPGSNAVVASAAPTLVQAFRAALDQQQQQEQQHKQLQPGPMLAFFQ